MQEAQARSVQLLLHQKQLDQKVTDPGSLQHKLTCLHADLGKLTQAKEVNAQVSCKTTVFDRILLISLPQLHTYITFCVFRTQQGSQHTIITAVNADQVVILRQPLSCLWETCNVMTTSDGFFISMSSVVDSLLHGPKRWSTLPWCFRMEWSKWYTQNHS